MEKTNVKLTGMIGIYLVTVAVMLGIVVMIAVISFNKITTVRADDTEKKVEAWIEETKSSGELNMELFPNEADYVLAVEGKEISSKILNGETDDFNNYINFYTEYGQDIYIDGQDVYRAEEINEATIFIYYRMGIPGEWIVLWATVILCILVIVVPSAILISRLRKLIYQLAEEKWRKEYETKQEMAQIAHDLKTPLTVIRGNADLLLEKDQDEDSKESLEAIISNAERIARSVLEILERE